MLNFLNFQSIFCFLSYKSGIVKNLESARVSIPPQLIEKPSPTGGTKFYWKNDLMASQSHWVGKLIEKKYILYKFL